MLSGVTQILDYAPPAPERRWARPLRLAVSLCLVIALGGAIGAGICWLLIPPRHEATLVIYVDATAAIPGAQYRTLLLGETARITSPAIVSAASQSRLNSGSLSASTTDWRTVSLGATLNPRNDLIQIRASHERPDVSVLILKRLLEEYVATMPPATWVQVFDMPKATVAVHDRRAVVCGALLGGCMAFAVFVAMRRRAA